MEYKLNKHLLVNDIVEIGVLEKQIYIFLCKL